MTSYTKPINFNNYTFRCSGLGYLMGEGTGKSPLEEYNECVDIIAKSVVELENWEEKKKTQVSYFKLKDKLEKEKAKLPYLKEHKNDLFLPQTAISYLIDIYCQKRDGIEKNIHSKYLENGKQKENDSLELLSDLHDKLYIKNTERKKNEFIEGECDIAYPLSKTDIVIDMKNAWDRFTYQPRITKPIDKIYYWQGIGYCKLWKAKRFILAYCLVNMPEGLIQDELKRILYEYGSNMAESEIYLQACKKFIARCNFDHLPLKERVFEMYVNFMESEYELAVERIKLCRKWLNLYSLNEFKRINGFEYIPQEDDEEDNLAFSEFLSTTKLVALEEVAVIEQVPFVSNVKEVLSNTKLSIDKSIPKDWYYISESESYHLLSKKEYNELGDNDYVATLGFFVCHAITYEVSEAMQVINSSFKSVASNEELFPKEQIENESFQKIEDANFEEIIDKEIVFSIIEKIESVERLHEYFKELKDEFISQIDEEIHQEFSNKEVELNSISKIEVQDDEQSKIIQSITNCNSENQCNELYKIIKCNFVKYPLTKELLKQKKDSFKSKVEEKQVEITNSKPTKPQKIENIEEVKQEKPNINQPTLEVDNKPKTGKEEESDLKKECARIEALVKACANSDEVRTIVRENKEIYKNRVDESCRALRQFTNDKGIELDEANTK